MAQSNLDFIKQQDKKIKEQNPWLPEFNYDETVTPETIFDKIKKATHKINIKGALETITSNSKSKLNSFEAQENSQENITPTDLTVATIKTADEEKTQTNDEYSKD